MARNSLKILMPLKMILGISNHFESFRYLLYLTGPFKSEIGQNDPKRFEMTQYGSK